VGGELIRGDTMKFSVFIASLIIGSNLVLAQGKGEFSFRNYPVQEIYKGKPAPANPASPRARKFKTRIKLGAKEGPNFAGHYTIVLWGCGSDCSGVAIVDAKTGQVFVDPELLAISAKVSQDSPKIQFRLNSSLLIIEGDRVYGAKPTGPAVTGKWYYNWEDHRLKLVRAFRR